MTDGPVMSSKTAPHRPLRIVRRVLAGPRRYARPWYLAYLLLGIVTAGMAPVLLPLMIMVASHHLSSVAYVMGMYDLGLLSSPLWGVLAERCRLYQSLFLAAFVLSTMAIAVFPFICALNGWMFVAFMLGAGSSGAATVASLLVVDFEPSSEWEPRIGMLQSFNGTGQVIGLVLAGLFSHGAFSAGLWIAAVVLVPALALAMMGLPVVDGVGAGRHRAAHPHRLLDMRALAAFPHINLPVGIGFHFHALNMSGLRRLPAVLGTPFARFLLSWFMLALGVAGFLTYFPLMLDQGYGVTSPVSAFIYAAAAAVGIVLFVLAGQWCARLGAGRVYSFGLWLRLIGFVLLLLPFFTPLGHRFAFAATGFALIAIAWPILSVAGTNLTAHLAPFSEGAAMGLFNAALALATVIGAFASGPLMAAFGYRSIALVGLFGLALAIALGWRLGPHASALQGKAPDIV